MWWNSGWKLTHQQSTRERERERLDAVNPQVHLLPEVLSQKQKHATPLETKAIKLSPNLHIQPHRQRPRLPCHTPPLYKISHPKRRELRRHCSSWKWTQSLSIFSSSGERIVYRQSLTGKLKSFLQNKHFITRCTTVCVNFGAILSLACSPPVQTKGSPLSWHHFTFKWWCTLSPSLEPPEAVYICPFSLPCHQEDDKQALPFLGSQANPGTLLLPSEKIIPRPDEIILQLSIQTRRQDHQLCLHKVHHTVHTVL